MAAMILACVAASATAARPLRAWRCAPPSMCTQPPAAAPQNVRSQAQERAELALATLAGEEAAPPEQQAEAIKALAEAGNVDQCLKLLRGMRRTGCAPTLESYGHVVTAFSRAGRPRDADRWMRRVVQPELGKRVLERSAAAPKLEDFNRVLSAYAAAGQPREAMETMRSMVRDGGVTPDLVSFNCLIAAYTAAGAPHRGLGWLQRVEQWAQQGIVPDVVSYTTVMAGFARTAEPERAVEVLRMMEGAGVTPNVFSYTAVVDGFAAAGQVEQAAKWLSTAREAGVAPNVVTYSAVAKGYAALGRLAEAQAGQPPLCASCTPLRNPSATPPQPLRAHLCTLRTPPHPSAPLRTPLHPSAPFCTPLHPLHPLRTAPHPSCAPGGAQRDGRDGRAAERDHLQRSHLVLRARAQHHPGPRAPRAGLRDGRRPQPALL